MSKRLRFTSLFLLITSCFFASIRLVLCLKLSLITFNFFFVVRYFKSFGKTCLNLVCLRSNLLGNFPAKTSRSVRKTYCTARQSISVRHFVYRQNSQLSNIIILLSDGIYLVAAEFKLESSSLSPWTSLSSSSFLETSLL